MAAGPVDGFRGPGVATPGPSKPTPPADVASAVDGYIDERLVGSDAVLDEALKANEEAGQPAIAVSAPQGKLLYLLARSIGAKRILEFGTLGGYSTIWLARALPEDGRLISLEANPAYAEVAEANIARAGVGDVVEVRVGPALDTVFDFLIRLAHSILPSPVADARYSLATTLGRARWPRVDS